MVNFTLKNGWLLSGRARLGLLLACAVSVASLALATVVHAEDQDGVPSPDASTEAAVGDTIALESEPTGTPAPAWSSDEGGTDAQLDTSDFVELTPTVPQGPLSQDNPFTTGTTDGSQGSGSDSTTTQDSPDTSWSDGSQGSDSDSTTTQDSPDTSWSDGSQGSDSDSTTTQDSPDTSWSDGSQGSDSDSTTTQDSPDSSSSDDSQDSGSDSTSTQDSPDSSSSDGSQGSGSDSTTTQDSLDGSSSDPQSPTSDEPTVGSPGGTEPEPTTGLTITEQAEVTATYTAASTATATATANDTTSPAETGTAIPNYTALTESTSTATSTYTAVPGTTGTAAATATVTLAPVETATAIPSATTPSQNTATATYTDTAVPTGTGIATATTSHTATATATASYTSTAIPTDTPAPTLTPTVTPQSTDTTTATPTPTDTETPEPETHCGTTSPDTYSATYLSADGEEGGAAVSFNLSISNNGEQLSAQLMIGGVPVNAEITQGTCQGCYTVTSADPDLSLNIAGYTVSSFVMDDGIGEATELMPADGTPASVNECAPPTGTAVATDTAADTATPTATVTPTATDTATETATATATATHTATYTETATVTPTETATLTATATATDTATETATDTATATPTETSTATPSVTPTSELSDEPDVCMSEDAFSQKLDDFMANQGVPDKFECDAEGSSMFAPQAGDSEMRTWTQSGARTFPEEMKSRALVDPDLCGGEGGAAQVQAPSQPFPAIAAKLAAVNAVKPEKGGTKCCFYQYSDEKSRGGGSAADGHKRSAFLYDWEWEVKNGKRDPNCDYVFDCPMLNDAPYPNPTSQRSCHLTRMWEDSREKGEGNYVRLATWGVLKGDNDPRLDAQDFIYQNASGRPFANEQEALRDFAARTGRTAESLPAVAPYYIGKDKKVIYLKKMKIPENASTEPIRASKTRSPIGQAVKKFGCTSQKHVQLTHANPSFGYQMCQSIFRDCKVEGAVEPDGSRRSYQAQVHGCSQIGFGKGMCQAVNDLVSDFKKRCEADPKKRESIVLIGNQVDNWHPDAEGSASCRWRNSEGYARGDNVGTIRKFKANKNGFIVCMRGGDGWIPDPHFCGPYGLKNDQTNNSKRAPELTCASSNTGK